MLTVLPERNVRYMLQRQTVGRNRNRALTARLSMSIERLQLCITTILYHDLYTVCVVIVLYNGIIKV